MIALWCSPDLIMADFLMPEAQQPIILITDELEYMAL